MAKQLGTLLNAMKASSYCLGGNSGQLEESPTALLKVLVRINLSEK